MPARLVGRLATAARRQLPVIGAGLTASSRFATLT
jgi:hypothetical protein